MKRECECGAEMRYEPPHHAEPDVGLGQTPERWECDRCGADMDGLTPSEINEQLEDAHECERRIKG